LKKIQILPLLFLLSFAVSAFPQLYIKEIKLFGNKMVSKEKIFSLMKTKVGAEFNEGVVREDIKRIAETGYFSSISYKYDKKGNEVYLRIDLVENPVIGKIYFSGNRIFRRKKLLKFLNISKGEVFSEVKLRELK